MIYNISKYLFSEHFSDSLENQPENNCQITALKIGNYVLTLMEIGIIGIGIYGLMTFPSSMCYLPIMGAIGVDAMVTLVISGKKRTDQDSQEEAISSFPHIQPYQTCIDWLRYENRVAVLGEAQSVAQELFSDFYINDGPSILLAAQENNKWLVDENRNLAHRPYYMFTSQEMIDHLTGRQIINFRKLGLGDFSHSFIQWLFPLTEYGLNKCAPLFNREVQTYFPENPQCRQRANYFFDEMITGYYGLAFDEREKIIKGERWDTKFNLRDIFMQTQLDLTVQERSSQYTSELQENRFDAYRVAAIAIGVILMIGGAVATGLLFSCVGPISLICLGAVVIGGTIVWCTYPKTSNPLPSSLTKGETSADSEIARLEGSVNPSNTSAAPVAESEHLSPDEEARFKKLFDPSYKYHTSELVTKTILAAKNEDLQNILDKEMPKNSFVIFTFREDEPMYEEAPLKIIIQSSRRTLQVRY